MLAWFRGEMTREARSYQETTRRGQASGLTNESLLPCSQPRQGTGATHFDQWCAGSQPPVAAIVRRVVAWRQTLSLPLANPTSHAWRHEFLGHGDPKTAQAVSRRPRKWPGGPGANGVVIVESIF